MWQMIFVFIASYRLVLVSGQTTSPVPPLPTPAPPEKDVFHCEPITIDICMDIGYNNATFPNFRLQNTQAEANTELQIFWPLIRAQCSNAIVHMLCAVYAPFCLPQFPNIRVRPCWSLCMHVRDGCEARLREFGFAWPPYLDCDQSSNDSLCYGPPDPVSDLEIPQSVLDQLGVTRAPDNITPGPSLTGCDPGTYQATTSGTCLPCPANSNSTEHGLSECPCFEGYYRAAGDPPEIECTRAESPVTLVVAATIPSIVAVIAVILVVILLCAYIHLRMKLDKISNKAANDPPEYATVGSHLTSIQIKENVAYETGMQSMDTKPNIAYGTGMQHNTST